MESCHSLYLCFRQSLDKGGSSHDKVAPSKAHLNLPIHDNVGIHAITTTRTLHAASLLAIDAVVASHALPAMVLMLNIKTKGKIVGTFRIVTLVNSSGLCKEDKEPA